MRDRGWAARILEWRWRGLRLEAEISAARYVIAGQRHEILAHAELRDPGGRRRIDVGSFRSMEEARAACEADAVARCRREREEEEPSAVDVRIAPRRRWAANMAKSLKSRSDGAARPGVRGAGAEHSAEAALDATLAAWAWVLEERD